jgi:hypothetical protein
MLSDQLVRVLFVVSVMLNGNHHKVHLQFYPQGPCRVEEAHLLDAPVRSALAASAYKTPPHMAVIVAEHNECRVV